jgi:hypothetical protein
MIRQTWVEIENTRRVLLHEAVATFERIVIGLELPIILDVAGIFWYLAFLTLAGIWYDTQWDSTKSSVPNHIENLSVGRITYTNVFIQVGVEILCGMLVYPLYLRPLWSLLFAQQPIRGMKLSGVWISDIKANDITWYQAWWVEFVGSFILQLLALLISGLLSSEWTRIVLMESISTAAVGLALDTAGGYFSPAYALILLTGTDGITLYEIFLVYWVGSILGTIFAYLLFRGLLRALGEDERKNV